MTRFKVTYQRWKDLFDPKRPFIDKELITKHRFVYAVDKEIAEKTFARRYPNYNILKVRVSRK